jgi:hypothetical protein
MINRTGLHRTLEILCSHDRLVVHNTCNAHALIKPPTCPLMTRCSPVLDAATLNQP